MVLEKDPVNRKVLTLYVGESCHLCELARQVILPLIAEADWSLEEIKITGDKVLMQDYGVRIPVVKTSDGIEKGWPFSAGQIKRLMADAESY